VVVVVGVKDVVTSVIGIAVVGFGIIPEVIFCEVIRLARVVTAVVGAGVFCTEINSV
jgi:hypothetical protein